MTATPDLEDLEATARTLRRGRWLIIATLGGLAAAGLVLRSAATLASLALGVGALAAGLAALWLGLRVAFDAPIFARWARDAAAGTLDLPAFDAAMVRRRLMPAAKAGRSLAARIAGATGLARRQVVMLALHLTLLALTAFLRILGA